MLLLDMPEGYSDCKISKSFYSLYLSWNSTVYMHVCAPSIKIHLATLMTHMLDLYDEFGKL